MDNKQRVIIVDKDGNIVFGQFGKKKTSKIVRKLYCQFKDKSWTQLSREGYSCKKISSKELAQRLRPKKDLNNE